MDPAITKLKSTTFSGRRLTRAQIEEVQETVAHLPNESRNGLCKVICEHLNWVTAKGDFRIGACMGMLKTLEDHDILELPPPLESKQRHIDNKPVWTSRSDSQPLIEATLAELRPIRLEPVVDADGRQLWNALVDRNHYLGYRKPFGTHIRYFVLDRHGRRLGCLLFDASTQTLPCRDKWIGWTKRARDRHRHLVVRNARFVLLDWVKVKYLASHVLAMAVRQLADDWERLHNFRPVLVETFVDETHFAGSCYRGANWKRIGRSAGNRKKGKTPKAVYVKPLAPDCQAILRGEAPARKAQKPATTAQKGRTAGGDQRFRRQWQAITEAAVAVAAREDKRWQKRRRVFDTLLIILFVFRLVFAGNRHGYKVALCQLWEHCQDMGIPLPKPEPPSAASACLAREKLDEGAFRRLHREVLANADNTGPLWKGHRIFGVDGSKINLPAPLVDAGYPRPNENAHYPQGLVSCLYDLAARIPVDFDMHAHSNERQATLNHLEHVNKGGVVVYDRGYASFAMLLYHQNRGLHYLFRIQKNANPQFDAFITSDQTDRTIELKAPKDSPRNLRGRTITVRLVKGIAADTECRFATSLHDQHKYKIPALMKLYHQRWRIEEMYGTLKEDLLVGFHSRSERGVKQELYAAFTLIALSRLFAGRCEDDINRNATGPTIRANFRNGMRLVGREIETLFLMQGALVREAIVRIMTGLSRCLQRQRDDRAYERKSLQPRPKWSRPSNN